MTETTNPRPNGTFAVINNWTIVGITEKGNPIKGERIRGGGPFATMAEAETFATEVRAKGGNPMILPVADWSFRGE